MSDYTKVLEKDCVDLEDKLVAEISSKLLNVFLDDLSEKVKTIRPSALNNIALNAAQAFMQKVIVTLGTPIDDESIDTYLKQNREHYDLYLAQSKEMILKLKKEIEAGGDAWH